MRKIMFIGQVQSVEFASKWRELFAPKLVSEGRTLGKFLSKNKNLSPSDLKDVAETKADLKEAGRQVKAYRDLTLNMNSNYSPGYNKKWTAEQSNGLLPKEYRKQRIEQLKEEAKKRKSKSTPQTNTQSSSKSSSTSPKIEPPKPTNSAAPKVTSTNTTKSPTSLLQPKSGIGIKGKLGIGAVGLLGGAALGYGIYRKVRSDKGKKRK